MPNQNWKRKLLTGLGCLGLVLSAVDSNIVLRAQIVAPSGRTLFNRNVMIRCTARFDAFDETASGDSLRQFRLPCAVNWGVLPDTSLVAVFPFQTRDSDSAATSSSRGERGLGDSLFLVQYDGFYRKTVPRGFTRVGAQFGVRAPTGTGGFGGKAPGYFTTGIFSFIRDRHWLISDLQFNWFGRDGQGRQVGNRWNYDFAYLFRLLPLEGFRGDNLFLVMELNGQSAGRNRNPAGTVMDSGGELLFFTPGVEYLPTRRFVLEFALPVPVIRRLNGPQQRPKLSFVAGFRVLF